MFCSLGEVSVSDAAPSSVSEMLANWNETDRESFRELVPLLYNDLRQLAHRRLRKTRPDHTLQTTALVNETYLRMERYPQAKFSDRAHFVAVCALMMRQILTEYERARRAAKRGGGAWNLSLEAGDVSKERSLDLISLNEALDELARLSPPQSRIVELRFFGGLSVEETAEVTGLSPATVKRNWSMARVWLHKEMSRGCLK
jgi:RNA polymerase sigma factor (TIGR02999 family)